jgi:hypothetical protein
MRVQITIRALDILIIVLTLRLAGMLRRQFFYSALFLGIVLGMLRLHYGLHYSWTFVGKIAVDFAVPLAMGWAGVHLAAEVKDDRERKLWQAVFTLLAVFGLVVGFLVESQLDEDHKKELSNLENGIKADMKENIRSALIDYNNAHPQHQITGEQFAELTRGFRNEKRNTETPAFVAAQRKLANGPLSNVSSDILIQMVPKVTDYLQDFRSGWYAEDYNLEQFSWSDREKEMPKRPFDKPMKTQEEWKEQERKTDDTYRAQLVQLLSDAEALREALENKLPQEAETPEDSAEVAAFAQARSDGSTVSSGLECCPASIKNAADYLNSLAKRVSLIRTLRN